MALAQNEIMQFPGALQSLQSASLSALAKQSFHQGVECLQSGEAAAAVAALSRSVAHAPDFAPAHVFLGIAHALTSNIYPALDHLELATQLEQDSFAAHYTLAQLNFKLRIPQKGYAASEQARKCISTLEQRKMLTELLKEERARERNGIARPCFNKPFSVPAIVVTCVGLLAAIVAIAVRMH
jgi:tetratricopeptide (TPR) repeat protein